MVGAFANGRLALQWGGGLVVTTVDWDTAQDSKVLGNAQALGGELGRPVGTPDGFITDVIHSPHWYLLASNGVDPVQTWKTDSAADLTDVRYTGTHLVWLRGLGFMPTLLTWKSVEIWASPYSADSAGLAPVKIGTWPFPTAGEMPWAAWGRFSGVANVTGTDLHSVHVWSVPDGEHRSVEVPATAGLVVTGINGYLTREDIMVAVGPDGGSGDTGLFRIPIAKMPIVPLCRQPRARPPRARPLLTSLPARARSPATPRAAPSSSRSPEAAPASRPPPRAAPCR
jgi:hypothetical protein